MLVETVSLSPTANNSPATVSPRVKANVIEWPSEP